MSDRTRTFDEGLSVGTNTVLAWLQKRGFYWLTVDYLKENEKSDGWITWHGDANPPATAPSFIDIKLREGKILRGVSAYGWRWSHLHGEYDIVAWRPSKRIDEA